MTESANKTFEVIFSRSQFVYEEVAGRREEGGGGGGSLI
eukprot:COSAG01_NODE_5672_length_4108_cov_2.077825_2_plen_39_part_00